MSQVFKMSNTKTGRTITINEKIRNDGKAEYQGYLIDFNGKELWGWGSELFPIVKKAIDELEKGGAW